MVGAVLYYLMVFVISLSAGIYNFSTFSTGSSTSCYAVLVIPSDLTAAPTSNSSNSTTSTNTTPAPTPTPAATSNVSTVPTSITMKNGQQGTLGTNIYSLLQLVNAILYLLIAVFSIFLVIIINSMANMVPDDFLKMGGCKRFLACFTKILPPLFVLIHYVLMVVVMAIWILILMGSCNYSVPNGAIYYDELKYYKITYVTNLVTSIIWILLQYVGAIVRDIVYQEPFMYAPTIGKPTFAGIMLKKVGP